MATKPARKPTPEKLKHWHSKPMTIGRAVDITRRIATMLDAEDLPLFIELLAGLGLNADDANDVSYHDDRISACLTEAYKLTTHGNNGLADFLIEMGVASEGSTPTAL